MSQLQNMISEHGRPRDPTAKDYIQITKQLHDLIRYKVLVENNVEVLAEFVLGYKPKPFHREFMRWQNGCKEGMLLAWRGSAKTTYCTITRCIFEILKNPNIRILWPQPLLPKVRTSSEVSKATSNLTLNSGRSLVTTPQTRPCGQPRLLPSTEDHLTPQNLPLWL